MSPVFRLPISLLFRKALGFLKSNEGKLSNNPFILAVRSKVYLFLKQILPDNYFVQAANMPKSCLCQKVRFRKDFSLLEYIRKLYIAFVVNIIKSIIEKSFLEMQTSV